MSTLSTDPTAEELEAADPELEAFYSRGLDEIAADSELPARHVQLLDGLETGRLRAARPIDGTWQAVPWIKRAILAGFRAFPTLEYWSATGPSFDREAFPPRLLDLEDGVRLVPGGSAVRRGAFLASDTVIMPPSYVNVGAWIGTGTLVDSHVLVGSCAQIGERVHLSAGAQIGGVLEPVGSRPVVVEDDAFVGGLSGLFEGIIVRSGAVLAPGVRITAATPILDLVHDTEHRGEVPPGAVVVPGVRPLRSLSTGAGIGVYAPLIVKYRDEGTDASLVLEEALR